MRRDNAVAGILSQYKSEDVLKADGKEASSLRHPHRILVEEDDPGRNELPNT